MFEVHRKCDCESEERRCHRSESEGRASMEEREGERARSEDVLVVFVAIYMLPKQMWSLA